MPSRVASVVVASLIVATVGAVVAPALDSGQSSPVGSGPSVVPASPTNLRAASDPVVESQSAPIEVDSCRTIDESGTYVLTQDIVVPAGTGTCFRVLGSGAPGATPIDVVLDGNGHSVVSSAGGSGISVIGPRQATVIKNLELSDWAQGVEVRTSSASGLPVSPTTITLSNVVVTGNGNGLFVDESGPMDLVIENSDISENIGDGITIGQSGVAMTISDTVVNGNGREGLDAVEGGSFTITDSEFSNNGESGIGVFSLVFVTLSNVVVNDNGGSGFAHTEAGDVEVADSEFLGNAGDGILSGGGSSTTTLTRVLVAENGLDGVRVEADASATILDSEIVDNTRSGVQVESGASSDIKDSLVGRNLVGVDVDDADGIGLYNNRIEDNADAGLVVTKLELGSVQNNAFSNVENVRIAEDAFAEGGRIGWDSDESFPALNIVEGAFLGGNYYGSPDGDGYSQTCADVDVNTLCDVPFEPFPGQVDNFPLAEPAVSAAEPPTQLAPEDLREVRFAMSCGLPTLFGIPLGGEVSYEFGYGVLGDLGIPPDAASQEWTNEDVYDVVSETPIGPVLRGIGAEPDDFLWTADPDRQIVRVFVGEDPAWWSCTCTVVD